MSEAETIESAAAGDRAALEELYRRHAPRVFAIARRIAGDEVLARDCSQETWLRVVRALPSFRGDASFSTWLHRIAANTSIEVARRHGRRGDRELPLADSREPSAEPRDPDLLLEQRLEEALDRLPDGMRAVLVMHDVEGFTHAEIGHALGIAVGTSKSQLCRARAKLRSLLRPVVRNTHDLSREQRLNA